MDQDPSAIIKRLNDSGMTEAQIAAAVSADGVPVTQATINRIKRGVHKRTSFEVGSALVRLARKSKRTEARAS